MTDDELLQRLAEIEGVKWTDGYIGGEFPEFPYRVSAGYYMPGEVRWRPLTDDAQAMALLKKYRVNIIGPSKNVDTGGEIPLRAICAGPVGRATRYVDEHTDLNRAICIAIVEAHSGTER